MPSRLTVFDKEDHCSRLPDGLATLKSVRGPGDDRVLLGRREGRRWQARCCFAAWLAVLLAIVPFTRPSLPVQLAAVSALPEALATQGDLQGEQPAAGLRPAQPATLGILSRLSLVETALGLPPSKPPLLRPIAEQPLPLLHAHTMHGGEPRTVFERSSVGTARTPTGPPA
jgi:hypothetical protein